MMTTDERQRRVDMILVFRKTIRDRLDIIEKQIKQNCAESRSGFHGGIWDDADDERERQAQRTRDQAYGALQATASELRAMWTLVVKVFGDNDAHLAVTQEEQKIGDLPYVVGL